MILFCLLYLIGLDDIMVGWLDSIEWLIKLIFIPIIKLKGIVISVIYIYSACKSDMITLLVGCIFRIKQGVLL